MEVTDAHVDVASSRAATVSQAGDLAWIETVSFLESASDKSPTRLVETAETEREAAVSRFSEFERLARAEDSVVPEECGAPSVGGVVDDMGCPEWVWRGETTESSGAPGELDGIKVTECRLEREYTISAGFSWFGVLVVAEVRCVYSDDCYGEMSRAGALRHKADSYGR